MKIHKPKRTSERIKSSLAFPFQPSSDRGFIRYMEESEVSEVFIDVFMALYKETTKPDNPLDWIRKYLREKAGERKGILKAAVEERRNEVLESAKELEQWKLQKQRYEKVLQAVQDKLGKCKKRSPTSDVGGVAAGMEDPALANSDFAHRSSDDMKGDGQIPAHKSEVSVLEADTTSVPSEQIFEVETEGQSLTSLSEMVEKATETSPQPSLSGISQESKNLTIPGQSLRQNPQKSKSISKAEIQSAEDEEATKKESILDEFWRVDFSLGKVEDIDEDSSEEEYRFCMDDSSIQTKFQTKRVGAFGFQEHEWLSLYQGRRRESLIPIDSDAVIEDALGTLTITTKIQKGDEENKTEAKTTEACYQSAKTARGVHKLRRDEAINNNLQIHGRVEETEGETDAE